MKVSTTLAVGGAVVAEYLASQAGLGHEVAVAAYFGYAASAFAAIALLAVIGIIFFLIVTWMERLLLPWYTVPREKAKAAF
jgi:NitT/TauT family transport system permease protein